MKGLRSPHSYQSRARNRAEVGVRPLLRALDHKVSLTNEALAHTCMRERTHTRKTSEKSGLQGKNMCVRTCGGEAVGRTPGALPSSLLC